MSDAPRSTGGAERLRVPLVDDSAFMPGAAARLLTSDGRFEVVGQASDDKEGVRLALELNPDVLGVVDTVAPLSRMPGLINRWVSEG